MLSAPDSDGIYYVWMDLEQTTSFSCLGNTCPGPAEKQYWGQGRGPLTDVSFLEVAYFQLRMRCTYFEFLWGRPLVSDFRSKPCHETLNHAICQVPCEPSKDLSATVTDLSLLTIYVPLRSPHRVPGHASLRLQQRRFLLQIL